MGMDFFALHSLVLELKEALEDRPIRSAFSLGKYDLYLKMSAGPYLMASCLPGSGRVHLVSTLPENVTQERAWGKGRLSRATCLSLEQMDGDRVLCFRFVQQDAIGSTTRSLLIVEMTGRNSNVILVDEPSGKIVDCFRRITPDMSRYRQIVPGALYKPPPPQKALDPRRDSPEAFVQALRSDPDLPLVEALSRTLMTADRSTARRIAFESGIDSLCPAGNLDTSDAEKLYQGARILYESVPCGRAFVLLDEHGAPNDFTAFDPSWAPNERKHAFPTLSEAIAYFYEHKRAEQTMEQTRKAVQVTLNRLIASTSRKIDRLREDLNRARKADEFKRMGELLTAYLHQVQPRQEAITLSDFYDPSRKITIPLDPNLSPADNAQRYFTQYRKAARGAQTIQQMLKATEKRLAELNHYADELSSAHDAQALESLRNRLIRAGTFRADAQKRGRTGKGKTQEIHPRRYLTSEGWTVLVGRDDRENDLLTHRAHPEDLWFHAQGCPGSHVVLKRESRKAEPSRRTLEEAAGLAAYWSKARTSNIVPVNYTLKKYVRKPKRGKPGAVLIQREKTLLVEPRLLPQADAARVKRDPRNVTREIRELCEKCV